MSPPDADFTETEAALYRPVAARIAALRARLGRSVLVGLSGPQGGGKTTGAQALRRRLADEGLRCAVLSIDDVYLTRAERQALAARAHPLLATRGPPGTHDLALAERTIDALLAGKSLALPRFDKGADDRAPASAWPWFEGPADVVLLEGWCVGARPQPAQALAEPVNALERGEDADGRWRTFVNAALAAYQPLFARIDLLIQLRPPSFDVVLGWRRQQEEALRAGGGAHAMSDAELARFVQHYERLTRWIIEDLPARADVVAQLDARRRVLSTTGL